MPALIQSPSESLHEASEAAPRKSRGDSDGDPDLTPMIDVTFLLLIFFIVASTPDQQTAIDLPTASRGSPVEQLYSTLLTIGEGGVDSSPVYAADGQVEAARLPDDPKEQEDKIVELVEKGLQEGKTNVVIKADKSVPFREVWRVTGDCSKVGGIQLAYAILEKD